MQGFGQIVLERFVLDEAGQPLTGSFMDYAMPRADEAPFAEIALRPVPTALNPLGAKGAGEAGTVGGMPCVMSAILDALGSIGADEFEMPATPERIWRAHPQPAELILLYNNCAHKQSVSEDTRYPGASSGKIDTPTN